MKSSRKLKFPVDMKNKLFTVLLLILASFAINISFAQSILDVRIPGAKAGSAGSTWEVEYVDGQNTNIEKEVKIDYSGCTNCGNGNGKDGFLYTQSSSNSCWQVLQGGSGSNSWKTLPFCETSTAVGGATAASGTHTTYFRYNCNTVGTYTETITIGFATATGGSCGTHKTGSTFSIDISVKVVNGNLYTWTGANGTTDSFYTNALNWAPNRSTTSSNDVLVVDMGNPTTPWQTTIDISGISDQISQFKIYPYNRVNFRCSTGSTANWLIGNGTDGDDFVFDANTIARKSGPGNLFIDIDNNNTTSLQSSLIDIWNGTLRFTGTAPTKIYSNIFTSGGTLSFQPTTSSETSQVQFLGSNQSLNRTAGSLYIDSQVNVVIGPGTSSTLTLNRSLPLYSMLTMSANATIASNTYTGSTKTDFDAWSPNLQFRYFEKVGSKAFGQLATMPSGASITGGCLFETYNTTKRSYRLMAAPMKNAVHLSQFTDDIHLTGTVTGNNRDTFNQNCSWCTSSIFYWDPSAGRYTAYASGNSPNKINPGSGALVFFRGSAAGDNGLGLPNASANEQLIDYKGQIFTGDLAVNLTSVTNDYTGYNLVANPYPCTIDFRRLLELNKSSNPIKKQFHMYDAIAKDYNAWDSTVTTGSNRTPGRNGQSYYANDNSTNGVFRTKLIPPGASFFVIANSNGAQLNFSETVKHNETSLKPSHKNFEVEEIYETSCNELRASIHYNNDSMKESSSFSLEFDINDSSIKNEADEFDVNKMWGGYLGIGTTTDGNNWFSIDRRNKLAETGNTHVVNLKTKYPKTGPTDMILEFGTCSFGNGNYEMTLVDKVLNKTEEIGDLTSYLYTINNSDEKRSDRFDIIFKAVQPAMSTTKINNVKNTYVVYPNPATDGQFNVVNNKLNRVKQIEIYNAHGQLIKTISNCTTDLISINLNASSGIYTAVITGEKNSETHRIAIP